MERDGGMNVGGRGDQIFYSYCSVTGKLFPAGGSGARGIGGAVAGGEWFSAETCADDRPNGTELNRAVPTAERSGLPARERGTVERRSGARYCELLRTACIGP